MSNFYFFEIKGKKKPQEKRVFGTSNFNKDAMSCLGFISAMSSADYNGEVVNKINNVTNSVVKGKYNLSSEYAIFFLYDFKNDKTCLKFMCDYGNKLCNATSYITILTYFTREMMDDWQNVYNKEDIYFNDNDGQCQMSELIRNLCKSYEVESLPALLVVKSYSDSEQETCLIDLRNKDAESIYSTFKQVIETINDNCQEDFSIIQEMLGCPLTRKGDFNDFFNTSNYIQDLAKDFGCTLADLAIELGMSERNFRIKRTNNTLTRNEILYIGIKFKTPLEKLNQILKENNEGSLRVGGREGVIQTLLKTNYDIEECNQILLEKGYAKISID